MINDSFKGFKPVTTTVHASNEKQAEVEKIDAALQPVLFKGEVARDSKFLQTFSSFGTVQNELDGMLKYDMIDDETYKKVLSDIQQLQVENPDMVDSAIIIFGYQQDSECVKIVLGTEDLDLTESMATTDKLDALICEMFDKAIKEVTTVPGELCELKCLLDAKLERYMNLVKKARQQKLARYKKDVMLQQISIDLMKDNCEDTCAGQKSCNC